MTAAVDAKLLKAAVKAGGKRGVEIEGAAAMGGLEFFCTKLDEAEGNMDLLVAAVDAMNAECDPSEEERKGGAGLIGKMVFSCNDDVLVAVGHVPEHLSEKVNCKEWMENVMKAFDGKVLEPSNELTARGEILADKPKGKFPLKMRDEALAAALTFLRSKGAFPDRKDDSSDDEPCFGDDFDFDNC
eukprot:Sdes_comp22645_c0_seq1m21070